MTTRDDGLGEQETTTLPRSDDFESRLADEPERWHGGLDLGLLVLRLVLGGTMTVHGLQKLFGAFGGPGIGGFAGMLEQLGYTTQTTLLSWVTALAEFAGGVLLVLGLFTPLGAAALLGVAANIVYVKFSGGFFLSDGTGYEYELMLAAAAFALMFTGSGRIALDKNTPWRRNTLPFGFAGLVLAAGGTVAVLLLCR
ncbi:putative oxidoreductase [Prauserella shujinwangii]|uniref:Putative oxidoreductase n=1 Tax=Prauserella shujinwangii TaxID=1453103 RepID=A0A2T0LW85_9PSEU|nr:DoxX family protein [Prauserella shujinwangii]PRX48283.1 putative oxidoreductase [Prauserella shujinwangii]